MLEKQGFFQKNMSSWLEKPPVMMASAILFFARR
jgi:hypothetical protein